MGLKISEVKSLLKEIFAYNLQQAADGKKHNTFVVPMLVGDPGSGKTAAVNQVAEEVSVMYRQVIFAQYDAGELAGLPVFNEKKTEMIRLRPSYLPPLKDVNGQDTFGFFNLDELPQAFLANQNIAAQLVNEYRVGEHEVPIGWTICCTGNKPENKAGTTIMPSHLKDRLTFIEVDIDHDVWLEYAAQRGVDPRIRAYIKQNPGKLAAFDPKLNASPTPRSWEKTSAFMSMGLPKNILREALNGQIGDGHTSEFLKWLKIEDRLPKIESIIEDPDNAPVFGSGKELDISYLLLSSLADVANVKNVGAIIKYLNRIPDTELSVFCMRDMLTRDKALNETKEVMKWKMTTGVSTLL